MFTRMLTIWDTVRASLWALPLAMVLAAGASAYLALRINISGGAKETPQFLSNLVTSMMQA